MQSGMTQTNGSPEFPGRFTFKIPISSLRLRTRFRLFFLIGDCKVGTLMGERGFPASISDFLLPECAVWLNIQPNPVASRL